MKIVFMGTPDFAVPCLQRILDDGHDVIAVYTQPDKPVGRHAVLTAPPVKELALAHHLPVFQPTKLRDGVVAQELRTMAPDCIVVVAYGRILPEDILNIPPKGCINIHGSLLPKYRGAAPIQWSVLNGETVTGVTSMFMDVGMDTGDIIDTIETPLDPNETSGMLFERLAPMGAELLSKTLQYLVDGTASRTPQDPEKATMAPMLDKELGLMSFELDAGTLHNLVRGLNPWPGAYFFYRDKKFKVHETRVSSCIGMPGEILSLNPFIVGCQCGSLEIISIQPEGKAKMDASSWIRGARLALGDYLL